MYMLDWSLEKGVPCYMHNFYLHIVNMYAKREQNNVYVCVYTYIHIYIYIYSNIHTFT